MIRLDRTIPFVDAALGGRDELAVELLRTAERRHGLRWFAAAENLPEDQREGWYRGHLWPFLSETHFVISAGELFVTDCVLLDSSGIDHSPTWREWGRIVADWANQYGMPRPTGIGRTPRARRQSRWDYMDFYDSGWLAELIEDYDRWRAAIWRILAMSGGGRIPG